MRTFPIVLPVHSGIAELYSNQESSLCRYMNDQKKLRDLARNNFFAEIFIDLQKNTLM